MKMASTKWKSIKDTAAGKVYRDEAKIHCKVDVSNLPDPEAEQYRKQQSWQNW